MSVRKFRLILRVVFFSYLLMSLGCAGLEMMNQKAVDPVEEYSRRIQELLEYSRGIFDNRLADKLGIDPDSYKDIISEQEYDLTFSEDMDSDLVFGIGEFYLSEIQKARLEEIIRQLIEKSADFSDEMAGSGNNSQLFAKIIITGYTDSTPFQEGGRTIRELEKRVDRREIPNHSLERRKFFNEQLSILRSEKIKEYIYKLFSEYQKEDLHLNIETEIVGMGEELPPELSPPYPDKDIRRRICKIKILLWKQ